MLNQIFQLLRLLDKKTDSEIIEIAKGKYQLPTNLKQLIKHKRWL